MGRFIDRTNTRAGTLYELAPEVTTLGREGDNTVVLLDDRVSRHHAAVRWDGRQYLLTDLDSRNGTVLNGERLSAPRPLQHGDQIQLGNTLLLFDAADETMPVNDGGMRAALRLDPTTAEVWRGGARVNVTAKEYLALRVLQEKAGGLVSKEELAAHVWPEYQGGVGDYNIEQLLSRLRRKIEPEPEHPQYLLTIRGLGYRLVL